MGQSVFVAKEKKDVTLFEYSKLVVAIFQMRSIGGGRGDALVWSLLPSDLGATL